MRQQNYAEYFGILKDSCQSWEWNQIMSDIKIYKNINEFLKGNNWDDSADSLANRVLVYRIEHQLYRTELAEKTGVSDSTIVRIEK